jgi:hypothetical protein
MWMDEEERKRKSRSADDGYSYTRRKWEMEVWVDQRASACRQRGRVDLGNGLGSISACIVIVSFLSTFSPVKLQDHVSWR